MNAAVEDPFGLVGTTLERRFAIDRVVARGGFGVVYQARHVTLKKPVAVKVLMMPTGLGTPEKQAFLASFEQEAQTIAALDHPAIVRAYDFGIARPPGRKELPWLALEWIEGESLAARLESRAGEPMSPTEALSLLRPALQGLAFAHQRHIAHRDLKPANIMLTAGDGSDGMATARLLDFGIAKVMSPDDHLGSGSTRTMAVFTAFSTPYASPEQKTGLKSGPWTDVHAMGLIFTELLTGQPPYPGEDALAVEMRIVSLERPTPARFGVDVGPWEPVLARAVALRPADRFPDAGALLAALEAVRVEAVPVALTPVPEAVPVAVPVAAPVVSTPSDAPPPGYLPTQAFAPPAAPEMAPVQGYAPPPHGYAPPPQGYAPPPQGYAPPPQGYAPPPHGHAPMPQGYAPSLQGYAPSLQGHAPSLQGHAPPPGGAVAAPDRWRKPAIISAAVIVLLLLSCVVCVAVAPERPKPGDNSAPAQTNAPPGPTMTPLEPAQ